MKLIQGRAVDLIIHNGHDNKVEVSLISTSKGERKERVR